MSSLPRIGGSFTPKNVLRSNFQTGTILNADVLTPVDQVRGLDRLKADVVQQVDANNLSAYGAAITTSRLGVPAYWLQSDSIDLSREQVIETDRFGATVLDPYSGQPQAEDQYTVDSRRNRIYMAGLPVFAWPRFKSTLDDSSLYLERIRIGNDRIFGTQVVTGWDLFQLLGIRRPHPNTRMVDYWVISANGASFVGSEFDYDREAWFGLPGEARGFYGVFSCGTMDWIFSDAVEGTSYPRSAIEDGLVESSIGLAIRCYPASRIWLHLGSQLPGAVL